MKKLAFSLICSSAFASNFVGLGFYGSIVEEEAGIKIDDDTMYHFEIFANKFYSEGESNFVYDARLKYSNYKSDFSGNIEGIEIKGKLKEKEYSIQALAGYGILVSNDVSLSFLGGLGYENSKDTYSNFGATLGNLTIKKDGVVDKDNSMFLKTGVAARKQFENNFTMSGGVYLKYFTKKIEDVKRFSPEVDLRLGYTFANNIYAGVKFGYENTLIGHGGKAGFELGYKF